MEVRGIEYVKSRICDLGVTYKHVEMKKRAAARATRRLKEWSIMEVGRRQEQER